MCNTTPGVYHTANIISPSLLKNSRSSVLTVAFREVKVGESKHTVSWVILRCLSWELISTSGIIQSPLGPQRTPNSWGQCVCVCVRMCACTRAQIQIWWYCDHLRTPLTAATQVWTCSFRSGKSKRPWIITPTHTLCTHTHTHTHTHTAHTHSAHTFTLHIRYHIESL